MRECYFFMLLTVSTNCNCTPNNQFVCYRALIEFISKPFACVLSKKKIHVVLIKLHSVEQRVKLKMLKLRPFLDIKMDFLWVWNGFWLNGRGLRFRATRMSTIWKDIYFSSKKQFLTLQIYNALGLISANIQALAEKTSQILMFRIWICFILGILEVS